MRGKRPRSVGKLNCPTCDRRFNVGKDSYIVTWEQMIQESDSTICGDFGQLPDQLHIADENELFQSDSYSEIFEKCQQAFEDGHSDQSRSWRCPICKHTRPYPKNDRFELEGVAFGVGFLAIVAGVTVAFLILVSNTLFQTEFSYFWALMLFGAGSLSLGAWFVSIELSLRRNAPREETTV